jgi:hypothetical protein
MVTSDTKSRTLKLPKKSKIIETYDMTWKALEEQFLMVPFVF